VFLLSAGNDNIYMLTANKRQRLRIDLEDSKGNTTYAEYDNFRVDSEHEKYRLSSLGNYTGTAGRYGMRNVGVTVLASLELPAVNVSTYGWLMNSCTTSAGLSQLSATAWWRRHPQSAQISQSIGRSVGRSIDRSNQSIKQRRRLYVFRIFIEYPLNLGSGYISMFSVNLTFDKTLIPVIQFCYFFTAKSPLWGCTCENIQNSTRILLRSAAAMQHVGAHSCSWQCINVPLWFFHSMVLLTAILYFRNWVLPLDRPSPKTPQENSKSCLYLV